MQAPGFWDDQERAAAVSAEHTRAKRKIDLWDGLSADVADLGDLAEMAAEDEEMAQALGLSLAAWHRSRQQLQAVGLDFLHPMQEASFKPTCEDALVAPDQRNQFDLCYQRECRDIANQALACLPERERKIVFQYHLQEMTMKEIGSKLGIDESRVSQLHSAAIERLRLSAKAVLERHRILSASPGGSFRIGRA